MPTRRDVLVGAVAALSSLAPLASARAVPVSIGRATRLPHGVDPAHPAAMEHVGQARRGLAIGLIPARAPTLFASATLGEGQGRGGVVARDGLALLGTAQGLRGIDAAAGSRWHAEVGAVIACPAIAPGDRAVVATQRGEVHVVSLADGRAIVPPRRVATGVRHAALVLDDGSIVVSGTERVLHRVAADLSPIFEAELDDAPGTAAALSAAGHIVCPAGADLRVLDVDGRTLRVVPLGGRASGPPACAEDGALWIALVEGEVVQIVDERRVRARASLGARVFDGANLALARDGSLRVAVSARGLVCLDARGVERWVYASDAPIARAVVVDASGAALTVDARGRLTAIEANGSLRWRVQLAGASSSVPVVRADGAIVTVADRAVVEIWT